MCQKKTAEENVPAHSLNIVTAMHQLEDEVEDFSLLAICSLKYNPAPPIKVNTKVNGFVIPMEGDMGTSTRLLNLDSPKEQQNANCKHAVAKLFHPKEQWILSFSTKGTSFDPIS